MSSSFKSNRGVAVVMFLLACAARAENVADFRYAPPWWQTSICLPDDWQKTLVGKSGELLYDYGGGKFDGFHTRIAVDLGGATWDSQALRSPKIPIVQTRMKAGAIEVRQTAFAVAPPIQIEKSAAAPQIALQRLDEGRVLMNWAAPPSGFDPGFRHIAVTFNGAIRYRFAAKADASYTVVFGLCEGHHDEAGQRVMDLRVEGRTLKTVDMIKEHGRNVPAMFSFAAEDQNRDGWIEVTVAPTAGSPDQNTILNMLWVFQGQQNPTADLMKGQSAALPLARLSFAETVEPPGPPRQDVVYVEMENTGNDEQTVAPVVRIESDMPMGAENAAAVRVGSWASVSCSEAYESADASPGKMMLKLKAMTVRPGQVRHVAIGVARGETSWRIPQGAAEAVALRDASAQFWAGSKLPYDAITVGDRGIQDLLESSIRNIYQAREIKEDLPAFQVGPTCYRGLWVVDGSFLMEAVTFVGRGDEARNGIRYLLKRQRPDGGFMLIDGHWKETGIVLWAVTRHAKLTGDNAWLAEVWPNVERGFQYIRHMRDLASENGTAANYRLIPAGFPDGGLGEKRAEYTNIYWTLAGMKAAIQAARELGKAEQANAWQEEYDDFLRTFRAAAERDMITDANGNRCLPIYMRNTPRVPPQKGQWAFLHAVFPGKVFTADDPLVKGNMAMLRAVESEGLVLDTGWLGQGIWNYFGSFYGHAWLWLGDRQKAIDTLYAFANHASPLLVWREEHLPQGKGRNYVGDMPHNWASAEFIRLVRHCLVLERGDELHLCEGLPAEWLKPNAVNRLKGVATEFGPINMEIAVNGDGRVANLTLEAPTRRAPARIILHMDGWTAQGGRIDLPAGRSQQQIRLK